MAMSPLSKNILKIDVYLSGTNHTSRKGFVVNPKITPTIETVLNEIGRTLSLKKFANRIFNVDNWKPVIDIADIEDGKVYVVTLQGLPLKKKDYTLSSNQVKPASRNNNYYLPPINRKIQAHGRAIHDPLPHGITLLIHVNRITDKPIHITITAQEVKCIERDSNPKTKLLDVINDKIILTDREVGNCLMKLHHVDGNWELVNSFDEIKNETDKDRLQYVGLWGTQKLRRNSLPSKLPPLSTRKKKDSMNSSMNSTGGSDQVKGRNKKRHTPAAKNTSPQKEAEPKGKKNRPSKEEDTVFHAKPVKHKRSSEKNRPSNNVDYDKDEGGVFKAKDDNKATKNAEQVDDTKDTAVDLPIDQVEAEEVTDEDITEENNNTKKEDDQSNNEEKENAAIKLQAGYRGHAVRKQLKEEQEAATVIQNKFREHLAKTDDKDAEEEEKDGHGDNGDNNDGDNNGGDNNGGDNNDRESEENKEDNSKEKKAATTIQAHYRGYKTRESLKNQQSSNTPASNKSTSRREPSF